MENAGDVLRSAAGAAQRLLPELHKEKEELANQLQELQRQIFALEQIIAASGMKQGASVGVAEERVIKQATVIHDGSVSRKLGKGKVDQYIREVLRERGMEGLSVEEIFQILGKKNVAIGKSSIYAALQRNADGYYAQLSDGKWILHMKAGGAGTDLSEADLLLDPDDES